MICRMRAPEVTLCNSGYFSRVLVEFQLDSSMHWSLRFLCVFAALQ